MTKKLPHGSILFPTAVVLYGMLVVFWSLTNWGCGLQNKIKAASCMSLPKKNPEKQSILFALPNTVSYKYFEYCAGHF